MIQFYAEQVAHVIKYADFVFCNEDEAAEYAKSKGLEATDFEGAAKLIATSEKEDASRPRVVVMTLGPKPTLVVTGKPDEEATVEYVDVDVIDESKILDTNGAGDAFVGGFFASLSQGKTVKEATKVGNDIAGICIQKSGAVFE